MTRRFSLLSLVLSMTLVLAGCTYASEAVPLTLTVEELPPGTSAQPTVTFPEATGQDRVVLAEIFTYDE